MKKISRKKIVLSLFLVMLFTSMPLHFAHAGLSDIANEIAGFLSWCVLFVVNFLGKFVTLLLELINWVLNYQEFNIKSVTDGWKLVRDVCNMLFIILLLVIAFATILRIDRFEYKKMLPKVILAAVFINFSKMISLFLIDISQAALLTFANAITGYKGAFVAMIGLDKVNSLVYSADKSTQDAANEALDSGGVLSALLLSLVAMLVATVVMVMLLGILVMRIVFFWVLIVLSPLAFISYALPGGGMFSKWWGEFSKYLIIGPMLAFFLWLSLGIGIKDTSSLATMDADGGHTKQQITAAISELGTVQNMSKYIISIGLLLGAISYAKGTGVAGAAIGASMIASVKSKGMNMGRRAVGGVTNTAKKGVIATSKGAGRAGLATLRTGDKLAGRLVGAGQKGKDSIRGTMRSQGLMSGSLQRGTAGVNKMKDKVKNAISGNRVLQNERRELRRDEDRNGIVKRNNKRYKANSAGFYQQVDAAGNVDAMGEMLRGEDGEIVKKMNAFSASKHDAAASTYSSTITAKDAAQKEKVDAVRAAQQGKSDTQKLNELKDSSTDPTERIAHAIELAMSKGLKDYKDVEMARNAIGGNATILKEFNDAVYKNLPELSHDMTTDKGRMQFEKAIDKEKIDSTRLSEDALKNANVQLSLKNYHGDNYDKVMEKNYNRGSKYETAVGEGIMALRNTFEGSTDPEMVRTYNQLTQKHAALTGNVNQSLRYQDTRIDQHNLGEFFSNAKVKELLNMNVDHTRQLLADNSAKANISNNLSVKVLADMSKKGENSELVRLLRDEMDDYLTNNTTPGTPGRQKLILLRSNNDLSQL